LKFLKVISVDALMDRQMEILRFILLIA